MTRALVVGVVLASLTVGCGSGGGGSDGGGIFGGGVTLDCAWLASDNCWKMTAAAASSCLPPSGERGVLAADKKTCTYASGATVTFTPALVLPVPQNADWNFTITNGGADCLHYENKHQAGIKLTVKGQTVTETVSGLTGLVVTCPDGKSYSNPNFFDLLDCNADAGVSLGGLPGNGWSDTSTSISVGLVGTASSTPLFDCALAP